MVNPLFYRFWWFIASNLFVRQSQHSFQSQDVIFFGFFFSCSHCFWGKSEVRAFESWEESNVEEGNGLSFISLWLHSRTHSCIPNFTKWDICGGEIVKSMTKILPNFCYPFLFLKFLYWLSDDDKQTKIWYLYQPSSFAKAWCNAHCKTRFMC